MSWESDDGARNAPPVHADRPLGANVTEHANAVLRAAVNRAHEPAGLVRADGDHGEVEAAERRADLLECRAVRELRLVLPVRVAVANTVLVHSAVTGVATEPDLLTWTASGHSVCNSGLLTCGPFAHNRPAGPQRLEPVHYATPGEMLCGSAVDFDVPVRRLNTGGSPPVERMSVALGHTAQRVKIRLVPEGDEDVWLRVGGCTFEESCKGVSIHATQL